MSHNYRNESVGQNPTNIKSIVLQLTWHLLARHARRVPETLVQADPAFSPPPSALLRSANDGFWWRGWVVLKLKLHSRNILGNSTVPLCRLSPSFSDLINKLAQEARWRQGKLLIKSHLRSDVTQCPSLCTATMTTRRYISGTAY